MAEKEGEVVCVTGASGFIGSWIVHLLLRRGYAVRATVKNLGDERETKHLEAIEGADSGLRLFQIDLLDYDSIAAAIRGATGVFHVASPCIIDQVDDPQRELLDPAIKGTLNVLTAAKNLDVRRVVVTSSISAMIASATSLADVGEDCWIDEDYCRQNGLWYPLSKALAEKAAWKFAEENGLDIVVVNPGMVVGPVLPPALNSSMQLMVHVLQGCDFSERFFMALVHVKDVALAHVLLYENTSAAGRHLCVESLSRYDEFAEQMERLYPEYKLPRFSTDKQRGSAKALAALKKLIDLGLDYTPMEQIVKDAIESLRSKGYLS
ncbi:cinnamoyl-CoA reductase CAD2-like [Salvia miltiorrhiza]|uniref:cinnamoyl-CoA reductase CAD2-like n=1 Tax=Salvia miltiorrhiza TaxID=226208 RepID=UPI0025AC039C|nr:cinnamoyl-CoA reductase CAD2-like [Salvia miltiorrhiza]XP_057782586.1 cinnamoyl-CoA reductase CAD2-like [Salvia miltiorrhiza]